MDKAAALAKFNSLLNELVAKQAKPGQKLEAEPKVEVEIESEEPEMDGELTDKGEILKAAMDGESEVESEDETEPEMESEEPESSKEELSPELQAMLERALGKRGPNRVMREADMGHVGGKKVPMAGITATEIQVVAPKGRRK